VKSRRKIVNPRLSPPTFYGGEVVEGEIAPPLLADQFEIVGSLVGNRRTTSHDDHWIEFSQRFRGGSAGSFENACIFDAGSEDTDYSCAPEAYDAYWCKRGWSTGVRGSYRERGIEVAEAIRPLHHSERWYQRLRGDG
jgi:hypothetical protein